MRFGEGAKLSKDKAYETSGIRTVYWESQFDDVFEKLMQEVKTVYLNSNEHARSTSIVQTQTDRFNDWCKSKFSTKAFVKSAPIMHDLRATKHSIEVDLMQHACNITEKGLEEC